MKYFYLFTLLFSIYSHAQIVNIPDANFKNALVNTNCVDTDGDDIPDADADINNDGEIQESEAEAVVSLWVQNQSISSLEGIQDFVNLVNLSCNENQLTSLNVNQNIFLEQIDCQSNHLLFLDLSQNINLIKLYSNNNQLISLNIKNGFNTILNELDATNNSCLNCIRVDDVDYANNAINWNKDVNTIYSEDCFIIFPDINFKNALVNHTSSTIDDNGDGEIQYSEAATTTSINVTNENISSMEGIEYFCSLEHMYCSGNQIEILDLSNNIYLEFLYCSDNQINYLDVSNSLGLYELECTLNELTSLDISQNYNLDRLLCSNNLLTSLDVSHLIYLKSFGCSNNNLTSLTTGNIDLEWFSCNNNNLTTMDVSENLNLKGFNCSYNPITSIDVSNNLNLQELNCKNTSIVELDVSINTVLSQLTCNSNSSLTSLNVKNGYNTNFPKMWAQNNPNLFCIQVDDETANHPWCNSGGSSGWCIDDWAEYSEDCQLGINDNSLNELVLYPNPTQDFLNLESQQQIETVKIYSLQGQLIKEESTNRVDVSELDSGMYFVQVTIEGNLITEKFIKN